MFSLRISFALFALLLSAVWPEASWAAYCMSTYTAGGRTYFVQGNQPGDPTTCAYVALSGVEWAAYQQAVTDDTTQNNQIAGLQTLVSTNAANITSLQSAVFAFDTSLSSLNSSQTTQDNNIAAIQLQQATLTTSVGNINVGMNTPFDYTFASGVFALFFASVVALWWISKSAGTLIEAVRKW